MLKLKPRGCHCHYQLRSHVDRTVTQTEVTLVENPTTHEVNEVTHVLQVVPPPIDSTLRASDFALEVQLRNGVNLTECPSVLKPSLEDFSRMVGSSICSIRGDVLKYQDLYKPSPEPSPEPSPSAD